MMVCAMFSVLASQLTLGCATAPAAEAKSADAERIADLERENTRLSEQLAQAERERDEARRAAAPRAVAPTPIQAPKRAEVPGSLPEVDPASLPVVPGVRLAAAEAAPDEEEAEPRMRPVLRVRGSDDGGSVAQVVDGSEPADDGAWTSEYENGLSLVRQKKYEQGEAVLRRFLEKNPNHPFSDNALYWLGESQYARGDYASAAKTFEAVVTRYPSENKVPDALLKMTLSNERLGHEGDAKKAARRLLQDHPDTAAARRVPERYLSK